MASTSPANTPPRPPRRIVRALLWCLASLLLCLALVATAAWWWIGSNTSLATALNQVASRLPAGQTLESRDVTGTVRQGGQIGWLRYASDAIDVEVNDAQIQWRLAPLLSRKLQLGTLHARTVTLTPRTPAQPTEPSPPLESLTLPLQIELPFRVDQIRWNAATPVTVDGLQGSYRYDGTHHQLAIDHIAVAQGEYQASLQLEGAAPMALKAQLDGTVRSPETDTVRAIDATLHANATGTLATEAARLQVNAELRTADNAGAQVQPMQADVKAEIAPWLPQPLMQALARFKALNVATLVPQAPQTQLSGQVEITPLPAPANGWTFATHVDNAQSGPWDQQHLPLDALQAHAKYDGTQWLIEEAQLRLGQGIVDVQGQFTPATQVLAGTAQLRALNPALLYSTLDATPITGSARAQADETGAVQFDVDLNASGGARTTRPAKNASPVLRIDRVAANGTWHAAVLSIRQLQIKALQAEVSGTALRIVTHALAGQGQLQAKVPGATLNADGQIAPRTGQGRVTAQLTDAATVQRWVQSLPGLGHALKGMRVDGTSDLNARWNGGWQHLQQQLQKAGLAPIQPTQPNTPNAQATPAGNFELQAQLNTPRLSIHRAGDPTQGVAPLQWELLRSRAELRGALPRAQLQWEGSVRQDALEAQGKLQATASNTAAGAWNAEISTLEVNASVKKQPGPWSLRLREPVTVALKQGKGLELNASAGKAAITGPASGEVGLQWQPIRFVQTAQGAVQMRSQGALTGLPLAWANAFQVDGQKALERMGLSGDLILQGQWDVDLGDALRAKVSVGRASGDMRLQLGDGPATTVVHSSGTGRNAATQEASASAGKPAGKPAGIQQAEVHIEAQGDQLRAVLNWDSAQLGSIQAQATTPLTRADGGWTWAADAPLAGTVRAQLPDVGVWSALAPPGWRVRGTLNGDVQLSGTRTAPQWNGTLGADQLSVRSLIDGVDLRGGKLRAALRGNRLDITEFEVQGGQGSNARIAGYSGNLTNAPKEGGTLTATGGISWPASANANTGENSGITMDIKARAKALQVLVRADRQVSVSGDVNASLQNGVFTLRGDLTTDRATIWLPEAGAPSLGSDVVVRSAALDREAAQKSAQKAAKEGAAESRAEGRVEAAKPPDIRITLNLGNDFALQGYGITSRLEGELQIRTEGTSPLPRITGEVRTVQGRYRAWGQSLDVETGIVRFNGPYDNPSLDILAIRPNITARAGVQVTGSAKSPRVRLYSDPELPDAEKLSWVVLGRSAAAGGAEAALLQQAALALLTGGGDGGAGGIAKRVGLDEIGFKGPSAGEDASASALTFGKRISKDMYVTYERSLSGVLGTLFIFYEITKNLQLRGQTGIFSAVDLIYTIRKD